MRVLVTGGSGFIGSNLIHHLFHIRAGTDASCCPDAPSQSITADWQDLKVLNLDSQTYAALPGNLTGVDHLPGYAHERIDVADSTAVHAAMARFQPDLVLHLAAESHVDRSIQDGAPFVRTNVLGTQALLDAVRRNDVPAMVHVSTDEVYGSIPAGQFAKEDWPLRPSSPYSASKAASDLLALAHHTTYGTPVSITRCTNNWGPRQHPEKLVPKIRECVRLGKPVPIYGTGLQRRDWIHVDDHVRALMAVAATRKWGEVFNVAGGCEMTNLEVVEALGGRAEFVKDRAGHDERYGVDDGKLRAMRWSARHSSLRSARRVSR